VDSPRFARAVRAAGPERGLYDALYADGELKLEYDSTITRNAAETFAAKKGNCLSLVMMTAAFARHMGVRVHFQHVLVDQQWSRSGTLYFASTHVNLKLIKRPASGVVDIYERYLVIDFLPPKDANWFPAVPLDEQSVVGMYLNNRSAEELSKGRIDDAYWLARTSIETAPNFISAYNTLGVIYFTRGDKVMAERVYKRALLRAPEDTTLMRNLLPVLTQLGKHDEAAALNTRLASIDPTPPFHYFNIGIKAMEEGRFADAKVQFAREVKRSPYYHEFHFWLALAHWRLGEARSARDQLALAVDTSTTSEGAKRYSTKLDFLRAQASGAGAARRTW
jgi:Tfp pilus assembly protein PilF